jgi:hypothetical protein
MHPKLYKQLRTLQYATGPLMIIFIALYNSKYPLLKQPSGIIPHGNLHKPFNNHLCPNKMLKEQINSGACALTPRGDLSCTKGSSSKILADQNRLNMQRDKNFEAASEESKNKKDILAQQILVHLGPAGYTLHQETIGQALTLISLLNMALALQKYSIRNCEDLSYQMNGLFIVGAESHSQYSDFSYLAVVHCDGHQFNLVSSSPIPALRAGVNLARYMQHLHTLNDPHLYVFDAWACPNIFYGKPLEYIAYLQKNFPLTLSRKMLTITKFSSEFPSLLDIPHGVADILMSTWSSLIEKCQNVFATTLEGLYSIK